MQFAGKRPPTRFTSYRLPKLDHTQTKIKTVSNRLTEKSDVLYEGSVVIAQY